MYLRAKHRTMKSYFLLLSLLLFAITANSQSVILDGVFNDWEDDVQTYIDTQDDGNAIDFSAFSVTNDQKFLYLRFSLSEEILINTNNSIYLEIDTDNDFWTGYRVNGIGAELGWGFASKKGYFNIDGTPDVVKFADVGFRCLPSITSHTFEIAIKRDVLPDGIHPLFPSDTIKICFYDAVGGGDLMPNDNETFTYVFQDNVGDTTLIDIEKTPETVRLMTYNVLHDGLMDQTRKPDFEQLLAAIQPDIITFNECWETTSDQAALFLNQTFSGQNWKCIKADEGNITCSVFEQEKFWPVLQGARITAVQYKLPQNLGDHFIVINSHLKCCDADDKRQKQADALIAFILDGISQGGTVDFPDLSPFVISGDLNLVGDEQQLKTLKTGEIVNTNLYGSGDHPDWDNSQIHDEIAKHTDAPMAYTWRNDDSDYWPGRLDFHIFSNSVMSVAKSFVVCTDNMSDERLAHYNLLRENTGNASDHLPRVTDFMIQTNSIKEKTGHSFKIYPNPSRDQIHVLPGESLEQCTIQIMDTNGRNRTLLFEGSLKAGEEISLSVKPAAVGVALLLIDYPYGQYVKRIVRF